MKNSLLFLSLLFATLLSAQSLSPTVIASGGTYSSAGGNSLSYTVGEMSAVSTLTNGSILTQGFQQPNDILLGLLDIEKEADGAFSIYPNPAKETVWFGYEFSQSGKAEITLYNIAGQKLGYGFVESYDSGKIIHHFDCTAYAAGNYLMSVTFAPNAGKQITISKKFQLIN